MCFAPTLTAQLRTRSGVLVVTITVPDPPPESIPWGAVSFTRVTAADVRPAVYRDDAEGMHTEPIPTEPRI